MAALLTFLVTSTPATGVLAALPVPSAPDATMTSTDATTADASPMPEASAGAELAPIPEVPPPSDVLPGADPTVGPSATSPVPEASADPAIATAPAASATPDASAEPASSPSSPELAPFADPMDLFVFTEPAPALVLPPLSPTAAPSPVPAAAPSQPTAPAAKPAPRRVVWASSRPSKLWAQLRKGFTVKGRASWYYGTRGYGDVAHVAMPGARFLVRGQKAPRARVCAAGRCVVVRVVDWCGCHARTPQHRVADLSLGTLQRLRLDPSRGVYRITVTLIRP